MAKLFIETYVGLQDGKLGALPLVRNPVVRSQELTIPTDATEPTLLLALNERIIRCVPRANCGFYLKGWANGAAESTATSSPVTTLTQSATEYFSLPNRELDWYNIRLCVVNDRS